MNGVLALLLTALALTPNDPISIQLVGGEEVSGRLARIDPEGLSVATSEGRVFVLLSVAVSATVDEETLSVEQLREAMHERIQWELDQLPDISRGPPPLVVGSASFVLPGLGQAMLGEWDDARGFLLADVALLSLGTYLWLVQKDRAAALPVFALDLIFRSASASQAADSSRRRRALLEKSRKISSAISP